MVDKNHDNLESNIGKQKKSKSENAVEREKLSVVPEFKDLSRMNSNSETLLEITEDADSVSTILRKRRLNNPKNPIIGHLNVNSIRNKTDSIKTIINRNLDILLLTETKLDDSFPDNQFTIEGYRLFRKDRNSHGGGLILYINDDIPCRIIDLNLTGIEVIATELTLSNNKWVFINVYKPPKTNNIHFLNELK